MRGDFSGALFRAFKFRGVPPYYRKRTVVQYWQNVPGAIAYLKEALRAWKRVDSPEAVFVAACKNGKKPEKMLVTAGFNEWYDRAYRKRLVQAAIMKDGVHYVILANDELVAVPKAMQLYPMERKR